MGVVEEETYHGGLPAAGRHRGHRGVRRERKQERIHRRDALRLRSGSPLRCDRERREEAEEAKEALRQAPFDKLRVCASLRQGLRCAPTKEAEDPPSPRLRRAGAEGTEEAKKAKKVQEAKEDWGGEGVGAAGGGQRRR